MTEDHGVISSLIVQTRPENMESVQAGITAFDQAEIHATDPCGKIIVVIEARNDAALADEMRRIGDISGVLGVNMVFHHNAPQ